MNSATVTTASTMFSSSYSAARAAHVASVTEELRKSSSTKPSSADSNAVQPSASGPSAIRRSSAAVNPADTASDA